MQNETITIGFTDTEPRVYVNGELRKSTLEVVWDEDGAIEKVYLALKPKQVTATFRGEPIDYKGSIAVERIDGDTAHLRHKDCPAGSGGVGIDAALPDRTWQVPVEQLRALAAQCPGCNGTFPLKSDSVEYTSRGADEITVDMIDGDTAYLRHKDCPSGGPSPTLGDWTWDVACSDSRTAECPGCKQTLPVVRARVTLIGDAIPTTAKEIILVDIVGRGRLGQFDHRGCPKSSAKTHGHRQSWEWEDSLPSTGTARCPGCNEVLPVIPSDRVWKILRREI